MVDRNLIFVGEDPWFKRITKSNRIPNAMTIKGKNVVIKNKERLFVKDYINNMVNNISSNEDLISKLNKKDFLILLKIIKDTTTKDVYIKYNGPWLEKLLSDDGINDSDLSDVAKLIISETFYHTIMLIWLESDYMIWGYADKGFETVTRVLLYYTTSIPGYVYGNRSSFEYFRTVTGLRLRSEFVNDYVREIGGIESTQLYTSIYAFHLKSLLGRITNLNEFTFKPLPIIDKKILGNASELITDAANRMTRHLNVDETNSKQVQTLLTSANFSVATIKSSIDDVSDNIKSNSTKKNDSIMDAIKNDQNIRSKTNTSIIDFLEHNGRVTAGNIMQQGKYIYDAFKHISRPKSKQDENGDERECEICKEVSTKTFLSTTGTGLVLGLVSGYLKSRIKRYRFENRYN